MAVQVEPADAPRIDSSTAHAKFPTGGLTRPDGGDFRVVGPDGKLAPHHHLGTDPETYSELFFKVSAGPGTYWIYFGNPAAEPSAGDFEPKCGLVVSFHNLGQFPAEGFAVRDLWQRSGRIQEYADFEAYLRTRGERLSAHTWPKIEFDRGDLAPSKDSLLIFHGWLEVPVDGTYKFSIASDDASALILRSAEFEQKKRKKDPTRDGVAHLELDLGEEDIEAAIKTDDRKAEPESPQKTVLYFPGGRGAFSRGVARAYNVGSVKLKKGVKEFFYYQTIWDGLHFAALAWAGPTARSWEMVSQDACIQPVAARIVNYESRANPHTTTFDYQEINTYLIDRHTYIEVEFQAIAPRKGGTYRWDFGDGVDQVTGEKATHVYVVSGKYPVSLVAEKDGRELGKFTVRAEILGRKEADVDFGETIARYGEIMRNYPFSKLSQEYFYACMVLYEKVHPDPTALIKVLQSYVDTYTPSKEAGPHPGQFLYYAMPGKKRINSRTYYRLRDNVMGFYLRLAREQQEAQPDEIEPPIRTYREIVELYPEPYPSEWLDKRAQARWGIGQVYLHAGGFGSATETFEELEQEARKGFDAWTYQGGSAKAADQYRFWIRSGLLGKADVLLHQGPVARMKELCDEASKVQRTPMRPAVASAKRASHRTASEDLVRRRWPEEALDKIRKWEVAFPNDKASGITEFLRGKALFGLRRFDDARKSLRLCTLLIEPDDPVVAETRFLDADALFWAGRRQEADAAFQEFLGKYPDSDWAPVAKRRLRTIEVIRMDVADEEEPYLVEHRPYVLYGTVYPVTGYIPGWGGRCRSVSRRSVLTYEFPIREDAERVVLRYRKKGVTLLHVNDEKYWQEPHEQRDADAIDQELLFADRSLWKDGKLKLTFRDGLNYLRYNDPVVLYIDWIELHLLRLERPGAGEK